MQSYKSFTEDKLKNAFPFWNTSRTSEIKTDSNPKKKVLTEAKLSKKAREGDKLRVVIVGDQESGKSAITTRFIYGNSAVKYDPTIKDCYRKPIEVDGKSCKIDVMDSAGQDDFIALKDQYMKTGQIIMVAFSVLSKESFAQVPKFFKSIIRTRNCSFNSEFPYVVLVGNNIEENKKRVVSIADGQDLADDYGVPYVEISAKTGTNIVNLFDFIVRIHRWNITATTAVANSQIHQPSGWERIFSHRKNKSEKKFELAELDRHSDELDTGVAKLSWSLRPK